MNKEEIIIIAELIVKLLAEERYNELYEGDLNKSISANELQQAVLEFGGKITVPPTAEAYGEIDIYKINENECSIDFDLWIDFRKSDLTLSCSIYKHDEKYDYSIDNLHVL
jgi:hypothetical protein